MGMATTGFKPRNRFAVDRMVPTETEKHFRMQTTQGDVHDEGASMFGGVAGHAGLFSDAYDLAMLYQMLLSGGEFNDERYIKKETIDYFTAYHSKNSRRGYGFDKDGKPIKTSELRHFHKYCAAGEIIKIEMITPEVFYLNNEYWVSYYIGNQIFDKKFIFVPDSIREENLILIENLNLEGVLHE